MRVFTVMGVRWHDNGSNQLGVFSSLELAQAYINGLNPDYAVDFEYFEALEVALDAPESAIAHDLALPEYN